MHKSLLDGSVCLFEGLVYIACLCSQRKAMLSGHSGMDYRRPGRERLLRICDNGQRLVFNLNQIERVARPIAVLGDYGRHALADIAHLVDCQDVSVWVF